MIARLAKIFLFSVLLCLPTATFAQLNTVQGGTGTTSPSGILYGVTGNLHLQTVTIGSNMSFSNGVLSSTGGGSGSGLSTTSPWTPLNIVQVVDNGHVTSIATSSFNCTVTCFASPNISQWTNNAGYLTGNQSITLSGAVSGSGSTNITTTYAGTLGNSLGGTGQNSSAWTGLAAVSAGVWYQVSTSTPINLSISGNAATASALSPGASINGVNFTGASSITVASTTLLANNNTFSGTNTFSNAISGSISGSAGSVANAVTFNSGGSGGSSPQVFNGSSAETISYNTVGAQVAGTYVTGVNGTTNQILSSGGVNPTLSLPTLVIFPNQASSTQQSIFNELFVGGTATTTIDSVGDVTLPAAATFSGAGLSSCSGASNALIWNSGTKLFGCNTISTSGGASSTLLGDNNTFSGTDNFSGTFKIGGTAVSIPFAINIGGTATTSVTTYPWASSWAGWDANLNMSANNFFAGFLDLSSTATTTLTAASPYNIYGTGGTNSILLPSTTAVPLGATYKFVNSLSDAMDIYDNSGNFLFQLPAIFSSSQAFFTNIGGGMWDEESLNVQAFTGEQVGFNGTYFFQGNSGSDVTFPGSAGQNTTLAASNFGQTFSGSNIFAASTTFQQQTNLNQASSTQLGASGNVYFPGLATGVGNGSLCRTTAGVVEYEAGANCVAGGTVTTVTATPPLFSSGGATPNITWAGISTSTNLVANQVLFATAAGTVGGNTNFVFSTSANTLLTFTNASSTNLTTGYLNVNNPNATTTITGDEVVASTSPNAFVVQDQYATQDLLMGTASTTGPIFAVGATTTGNPILFSEDQYGHLVASSTGATPTVSCTPSGGTLSASSNDASGVITTGAASTACTLTFAHAYATTPTVQTTGSIIFSGVTAQSTTAFTVSMVSTTGDVINYWVIQP